MGLPGSGQEPGLCSRTTPRFDQENGAQPSPECRIPARELARAADTARTTPGMGWRNEIAIRVGKIQEKQEEKTARQAGRVKP